MCGGGWVPVVISKLFSLVMILTPLPPYSFVTLVTEPYPVSSDTPLGSLVQRSILKTKRR